MQATIALLACLAAFVVPVGLMLMPILGLSEHGQIMEVIKAWLAYIGPFAATIIAFYFKR
jgi:hypothetical protein